MEGSENRITVERQKFNDTVRAFLTFSRQFPASIVAGMRGFPDSPDAVYFKAAARPRRRRKWISARTSAACEILAANQHDVAVLNAVGHFVGVG